MAKKKLTYTEAVAEIEQMLARLRGEQMDVDTLASEDTSVSSLLSGVHPMIQRDKNNNIGKM